MARILSTALRNAVKKAAPEKNLEFGLKNIRINADVRGCRGYVHDPATGNTVYVDTEPSCIGGTYLVRSTQGKEKAGCYGMGEGSNYHEKSLEAVVRRVHTLLREPHFIQDWNQERMRNGIFSAA